MEPYLYDYSGIKNAYVSVGDMFIGPFMGVVDDEGVCIGTSKEGFIIWWYTMYSKPEAHQLYTKQALLNNEIIRVGHRWRVHISEPFNGSGPGIQQYDKEQLEKIGEKEIEYFIEVKNEM